MNTFQQIAAKRQSEEKAERSKEGSCFFIWAYGEEGGIENKWLQVSQKKKYLDVAGCLLTLHSTRLKE